VDQAVQRIRDVLDGSCCAGDLAPKLLKRLDDPSFVIEFKDRLKTCGFTPLLSVVGLGNKVQIGPLAWDCCFGGSPTGIESLASTILHETSHVGFGSETRGKRLELQCFGCGSPTDPKFRLPPIPVLPHPAFP
jgi:hypothetical protein